MARQGMDVDQVESAGKELKARSQEIDALVAKVDGIVRKLPGVWDGPDAQQFVNEWWPEHKKSLAHVSTSVAGLGQSALNNASQQRQVSGSNGGGLGPTLPGIDVLPRYSDAPPVPPLGGPPPSQDAFDARGNDGVGVFAPGGDWAGQCTSWVHFRRSELGLPSPISWKGDEFIGGGSRPLVSSADPSPGAVGSFPGHTFVVEGVSDGNPRSISVSEMNYGAMVDKANSRTTGYGQVHTDTYTETAPGSGVWQNSAGAKHTVKFAQ